MIEILKARRGHPEDSTMEIISKFLLSKISQENLEKSSENIGWDDSRCISAGFEITDLMDTTGFRTKTELWRGWGFLDVTLTYRKLFCYDDSNAEWLGLQVTSVPYWRDPLCWRETTELMYVSNSFTATEPTVLQIFMGSAELSAFWHKKVIAVDFTAHVSSTSIWTTILSEYLCRGPLRRCLPPDIRFPSHWTTNGRSAPPLASSIWKFWHIGEAYHLRTT